MRSNSCAFATRAATFVGFLSAPCLRSSAAGATCASFATSKLKNARRYRGQLLRTLAQLRPACRMQRDRTSKYSWSVRGLLPNGPLGADDVVEPRQVLLQHFAVKEEQRAQCLVLGGGGDLSIHGQRGQELRHLGAAHLEGMALVVKENVPGPRDVGLFGAPTVVAGAHRGTRAVEQAGLRRLGRSRLACDHRAGASTSRRVDNRSGRAHKFQWHLSFPPTIPRSPRVYQK